MTTGRSSGFERLLVLALPCWADSFWFKHKSKDSCAWRSLATVLTIQAPFVSVSFARLTPSSFLLHLFSLSLCLCSSVLLSMLPSRPFPFHLFFPVSMGFLQLLIIALYLPRSISLCFSRSPVWPPLSLSDRWSLCAEAWGNRHPVKPLPSTAWHRF